VKVGLENGTEVVCRNSRDDLGDKVSLSLLLPPLLYMFLPKSLSGRPVMAATALTTNWVTREFDQQRSPPTRPWAVSVVRLLRPM
jgi:hypothetical protein